MQQQHQQQVQQQLLMQLQQPQSHGAASSADVSPVHVRLRGLPFTSTEQDVLAFFAKHDIVDRVSEEPNTVRMLPPKASGKPSGQATIRMLDKADVAIAIQVLNGQNMGSRYIEVFQDPEADAAARPVIESVNRSNSSGLPHEAAECGVNTLQQGALPKSPPLGRVQVTEYGDHCGLPDSPGDTGGSGGPLPVSLQNFTALGLTNNPQTSHSLLGSVSNKAPEQESSWEALYDFLKRGNGDPPLPSAAALHGLVGDSQEGNAMPQPSTSCAGATRV